MKYAGLKMGLALASALTLLTASGAARQTSSGSVTREEAAEARATAAAFADRLRATNDFASVARELYADDFMSRQLKGLYDWSGRAPSNTFMLGGIPSLTFERALATRASAEDWKRLRLAESLAKGKHLDTNLRLFGAGFARSPVRLSEGEEAAGYPEGTRLFRVFAPNAYSLLLVRQGGTLKIVWASLPTD